MQIVGHSAKATPDGHTLVVAQNGLAMAPWLFQAMHYDPLKDLAPITIAVTQPMAVAVNVDLPIRTIGELIAYAKANPEKLSYATPGSGTPHHLSTELFKQMTGTQIMMVPYKGLSAILPDLYTGRVSLMFGALNSLITPMQTGRIRLIALGERTRLTTTGFTQIPTIAETVPGYEANIWVGMMAPAGTPDAVVRKVHDEIRAIVRLPDVSAKLVQAGFEVNPGTPDEMRTTMRREYEKWGRVVKAAGIKPE